MSGPRKKNKFVSVVPVSFAEAGVEFKMVLKDRKRKEGQKGLMNPRHFLILYVLNNHEGSSISPSFRGVKDTGVPCLARPSEICYINSET